MKLRFILLICVIPFFVKAQDEQDSSAVMTKKQKHENPRFAIAASGGLSWRLADVSPDENDLTKAYIKDLKSGNGFEISAKYFFNSKLGVGIKYNSHLSKVKYDNMYFSYNNQNYFGTVSDDISINTIAATFSGRFYTRQKTGYFTFDGGIGLMTYKDESKIATNKVNVKGNTLGFNVSAGVGVNITRNISLVIGFNFLNGTLSQYDVTENGIKDRVTLNESEYQSLSHIDIFEGLVITF